MDVPCVHPPECSVPHSTSPSSSSSCNSSSTSPTPSASMTISTATPHRPPFLRLPIHCIRFILSFLPARSLCGSSSPCCRLLYRESHKTALYITEQLRQRIPWIRDVLAEADSIEHKNGHLPLPPPSTLTSICQKSSTRGGCANPSTLQRDHIKTLHFLTSPHIMCVGGNTEPRKIDSLDSSTLRWFNWSPIEVGREVFFEVLWYQGYIYSFCGIHHSSYSSVERFNCIANTWQPVASLPGRLAGAVGAELHGQIYIIGGYDWNTRLYSDAVYVLQTDCNSWNVHPARLRAGRSSHAAVTFRNMIWIAGGIFEGTIHEGNSSVEIFDPTVGFWVPGPELRVSRFRLRLFVLNDELYAVGGDRDEKGRLIVQTIDKLDADMKTWVYVTSFKQERRGFLSSVIGKYIYVLGGRTDGKLLSHWDAFDVEEKTWLSDADVFPPKAVAAPPPENKGQSGEDAVAQLDQEGSGGGGNDGETMYYRDDVFTPSSTSFNSLHTSPNTALGSTSFFPPSSLPPAPKHRHLNRKGVYGGRAVTFPDCGEVTW